MAIDASIYQSIRQPQQPDLIGQAGQFAQLQGAQQQNRLAAMKMDEYERGVQSQNRLRTLLAEGADAQGLVKAGFLKEGQDWEKNSAEVGMKREDLLKAKMARQRDALASVSDPQAAASWVQATYADPDLGPSMQKLMPLESAISSIPQEPAAFQTWLQKQALGAAKFIEYNKPTVTTRNLGGTTDTLATEGLTGITRTLNSAPNTQSPDNAATNATSRANNAATVGASYANAQAARDAGKATADATRDAAGIQRDRDTEMKLADDYRAQSKGFKEVGDAYKQINATLDKATTSPAATLAAATKFMKLLDPGSVVRESELGMALAATGVIDRLTNYHNTLAKGKVLTTQQAADFKRITGEIYQAAQQQQQTIDKSYRKTAETYNLRPETIVQDLGQNAPSGEVVNFGDLK